MSNKSDHKSNRMRIDQYLPSVHQSDLNVTLAEGTFNRHLTKDNTVHVNGYVGEKPAFALNSRRIVETDPHIAAFQLEPVMVTQIGVEQTVLTQESFLSQLGLMGINVDRLPTWGSTTKFNWVPPINMDMLINYQNYYWKGDINDTSPQYFTIESACNKATAQVESYRGVIAARNNAAPIVRIDLATNSFVLSGYLSSVFVPGHRFNTVNTSDLNFVDVTWTVDSSSVAEGLTTVTLVEPIAIRASTAPTEVPVGRWWFNTTNNVTYAWDGVEWTPTSTTVPMSASRDQAISIASFDATNNTFTVNVDVVDIFAPGFKFQTINVLDAVSTKVFNDAVWTVIQSQFDSGSTIIAVSESISTVAAQEPSNPRVGQWWTNPTTHLTQCWTGQAWTIAPTVVSMDASLIYQLRIYESVASCACNGQRAGWDQSAWDDNQLGDVLWTTALLDAITYSTEAEWISANGAPSLSDRWYDVTTNTLYHWTSANAWEVSIESFSTVLDKITGTNAWDASTDCVVQQPSPWYEQNKWIHKSQISSTVGIKRAAVPILEYNSKAELNSWVQYKYDWRYRPDVSIPFSESPTSPQRLELEPIKDFVVTNTSEGWVFYLYHPQQQATQGIDYTDTFVPGFRFRVTDDSNASNVCTVSTAKHKKLGSVDPVELQDGTFVTVVTITESDYDGPTEGNNILHSRIEPVKTSTGDSWRGYNLHWYLNSTNTETVAAAPQPLAYPHVIETPATLVVPGGEVVVYSTYQETLTNIETDEFTLHTTLTYDPVFKSSPFALAGCDQVRVYVNGVRQYGNYEELTSVVEYDYVVVGNNVYHSDDNLSPTFEYVTGIKFNYDLPAFSTVRVEIGTSARTDIANSLIAVRTVESDSTFAELLLTKQQPEISALPSYAIVEQQKHKLNQYPLFNLYDVVTGEVVKANQLFKYQELDDNAIDPATQTRITVADGGREYVFEQLMLDGDALLAYRHTTPTPFLWFNPLTNTVTRWTGSVYDHKFTTVGTSGSVYLSTAVCSASAPKAVEGQLWFNTSDTTLYVYNITTRTWDATIQPAVRTSTSDPLLQTIWKSGHNNEQYVPQYVDENRQPVAIGSSTGSWETLSQWYFNSEHLNKSVVSLSQLISHFSDILSKQIPIPALQGGGVYGYTQDEINAGLGGLIREHNNSFDLLISAINSQLVTPVKVLEFARDQYENLLLNIRQLAIENMVGVMTSSTAHATETLHQAISSAVITQYEQNDFTFRLYGDSPSYDSVNEKGIRNWIATAPMIGLTEAVEPILLTDDAGYLELIHHDGHRSLISLSLTTQDAIATRLVTSISTVDGTVAGVKSNTLPPSAFAELQSSFPTASVYLGKLWYTNTFGTRTLYRLQAYAITDVVPAITSDITPGTKYYNTVDQQVYELTDGEWNPTSDAYGKITSLWVEVSINNVLGDVLLDVEQRLYDVSVSAVVRPVLFDVSPEDAGQHQQYLFDQFNAYLHDTSNTTPYVNNTYSSSDAFTWNYAFSTPAIPPHSVSAMELRSTWQSVYEFWYNTPTPHLEPWKLQGYVNKPVWWDEEYLNVNPLISRKWKYNHATHTGMWENIRMGVIPTGRQRPVGTVPTYLYVPVNIDDIATGGTSNYQPDDLLPPYFNTSLAQTANDVRSIYTSYSTEIVSPDADYAYGFGGPSEWKWKTSIQYVYDQLIVNFLMEPAKFLHYAFGPTYVEVDGLRISADTRKVYAHQDIVFHGDAQSLTANAEVNGVNQWYVNFNRYSNRDVGGQFNTTWTKWSPRLAYQTSGISDTSTFNITNKYFDITKQDYQVTLAKDGVVADVWVDAFQVNILSMPPSIIQYNNQNAWKLSLSSLSPISRTIPVYGTIKYPFNVGVGGTLATVYAYSMLSVDPVSNWITIMHDQTSVFMTGTPVVITNSTNAGEYTVQTSMYNPASNTTKLLIVEPLVDAGVGTIAPQRTSLPWAVGDQVIITSSKMVPQPLVADTPYFVIPDSPSTFRLAETRTDAMNGVAIEFVTTGSGIITVGQAASTFQAYAGMGASKERWMHYEVDKNVVRKLSLPMTITGIQELVDILDGYQAYQQDQGIVFSSGDVGEYDEQTGRLIGWQSEIERFIDWAFSLRNSNVQINDRYDITVSSVANNEFTFTGATPRWVTGTPVVLSTSGAVPTNTSTGVEYYIINTGDTTFKLSSYKSSNPLGVVDIQSTGVGALYISVPSTNRVYPAFEINPTRNQIVISTPIGVVSNVLNGEYGDMRVSQTLFDQYGRPLTADKIHVYRQDLQTRIVAMSQMYNDVQPQIVGLEDQYAYLHMGGAHIFVDKYQHIVLFNNTSISGSYMYDPFVGLNVKRFNLDYYETENYTLRPTIGGHFLRGDGFYRNMEGSIADIQTYYSSYDQVTQNATTKYAKALLDYHGSLSFLDALNVTPNSQFAFYRGMLQSKGSIASVHAYINSRRFVDAKIDEFWAWKLAEFGDARAQVYPEVKLKTSDSIKGDIHLLFAADADEVESEETAIIADLGFEVVPPNSVDRLYNQPEQTAPLFMDVNVTSRRKMYFGATAPITSTPSIMAEVTWVDTSNLNSLSVKHWAGSWTVVADKTIAVHGQEVRVKLDVPADAIRVVFQRPTYANNVDVYASKLLSDDSDMFDRISAEVVSINVPALSDGNLTIDAMISVYALTPTADVNNAARLVDTKSHTSNAAVPLWDPARGIHDYAAIHNVDIFGQNPASYLYTMLPTNESTFWNDTEVGTVWVDTNLISYVPYYDDVVYPNVHDRLRNWGRLAEWASVTAYEWIESSRPPEQWDQLVATGTLMRSGLTASGTPLKSVFAKKRDVVQTVSIVGDVGDIRGYGRLRVPVMDLHVDDVVIITTATTAITPFIEYTVLTVAPDPGNANFLHVELVDADGVRPMLDVSVAGLTLVKGWKHYEWYKVETLHQEVIPALTFADNLSTGQTASVVLNSAQDWTVGDLVNVYVNGSIHQTAVTLDSGLTVELSGPIKLSDRISIVRPLREISDADRSSASSSDDGTLTQLWTDDYEYSTAVRMVNGVETTLYYFWVSGGVYANVSERYEMSPSDISRHLVSTTSPYMVYHYPKDDPSQSLAKLYGYGASEYGSSFSMPEIADVFSSIPVYYRGVTLRNISHQTLDDDRYVMQFVQDKTLRYQPGTHTGSMDLKTKHNEWLMIRKHQLSMIPRALWDKVVESMVGYKLSNPSIRVPALDRELYDDMYHTDTKYGLGDGQTFIDKDLALATIQAFLRNPEISFYPISVDAFLSTYSFDTPSNIASAMAEIYNTFGTDVVNALWFELLHDALSTKAKHKELMKTSWIALHGIRILDVGGMFDD